MEPISALVRRLIVWFWPPLDTVFAVRTDRPDAAATEQWERYLWNLEHFEKKLPNTTHSDEPEIDWDRRHRDFPDWGITENEVASLLSTKSLAPPFGIVALTPPQVPTIPDSPGRPDGPVPSNMTQAVLQKESRIAEYRQKISRYAREVAEFDKSKARFMSGEAIVVGWVIARNNAIRYVPQPLRGDVEAVIDVHSRVCLCTITVPDLSRIQIVKKGKTWKNPWPPVSVAQRRRLAETILYSLCLRAAYIAAASDARSCFDVVAVNARQEWVDAATGKDREGIVASLQAQKAEVLALRMSEVDAKACFRHLKGIATPSIDEVSPVRPIFALDTNDGRVVDGRNVAGDLEPECNLAAMPWDDFEHLVRQLFEWEFGGGGVEVKVTRASRDRGVDAIVFDPDPIRGGKYVIQAKRYTRTVDVAAVRDLYGTVMNEGANRGILVTTSSYGPDSYEFAKDKPISLVDGPNLLARLTKHGRRYRINLEEARRAESGNAL